jgi:hypothetical protein
MKILKYLIISSLLMALAISCEKGIDPINSVAPGTDSLAPTIVIAYPLEGTKVQVPDEIATITIKLTAVDDIELKKVSLLMDGEQIASFSSFKDYRRAVLEYKYDSLTMGDHVLSVVATDLSDKSTTQLVNFKKIPPYVPLNGEVFYMPFDGDFGDLISLKEAKKVGSPSLVAGRVGQAYAGAKDSYLTFPTTGILGAEFSVSFWYKLNGDPLRAGILSISNTPPVPMVDSTRRQGFRLARENSGDKQNIFVNFGIGTADVWMNPFIAVAPSDNWMHIAVTISANKATCYVNGAVVKETGTEGPLSWAGCKLMSIGSGEPNFTYWEHFSDKSQLDELRIFNKALTAEEVTHIFTMK